MLDQNLPSFYFAASTDNVKHHSTVYFTRGGDDPEPAYSIQHADPNSPSSRNCYAAALFDPYNPEVLYGEVLVHPKWSQPSLFQDDIRRNVNGGIPPPPEPLIPTEFTVQLYNPDQQILVKREAGSLVGNAHYDFSMPVESFRAPSGSSLDRGLDDPAADITTQRIKFTWKKEGKLSNNLICAVTGRSTDAVIKKKNKEPDIPVALFRGLRDITLYESNFYRLDMEDPKGLEMTMLLQAAVIRDIFYGNLRTAFNTSDQARRSSAGRAGRSQSDAPKPPQQYLMSGGRSSSPPDGNAPVHSSAALNGLYQQPNRQDAGVMNRASSDGVYSGQSPPRDPMRQWEIDAETARLRAQEEAEAKERRRQAETRRREEERASEEAARQLRKQEEREAKERQRQQREVEKETERLRKIYGSQGQQPPPRNQTLSAPSHQGPFPFRPHSAQGYQQHQQQQQQHQQHQQQQQQQQPPGLPSRLEAQHYGAPTAQYLIPTQPTQSNQTAPNGKKQRRRSFLDLRSR